jgi:hypothetical protein
MQRSVVNLCVFGAAVLLLGAASGSGQQDAGTKGAAVVQSRLRAGASQTDITPPVGAPLLGALVASTGVHDPLFARALVLGDGPDRVAIVCLDLVGMDFSLVDEIRGRVQKRVGAVTTLLSCSHTHSAPFTIPWSVQGWRWLSGEGRPWRDELVDKVTDAVARAAANLTEATLRVGRAPAQVGMNRRLPTPGGVVMKPNPEGVIVPWVDVLRVDRVDGKPIAILFSHAAHPVIVHGASTLASADYPAYAVAAVQEQFGKGAVVMFAQACGGNINGEPLRGGFEAAERAGKALGQAAAKAAAESKPLRSVRLRSRSTSLPLPLEDWPSPDDCQRALKDAQSRLAQAEAKGQKTARGSWYLRDDVFCLQDLLQKARRGGPGSLRFDLHLLAVGDEFCLLTMTHEVFAEYQLWIDRVSPFRHTMVLAYTNGCESYVPTDKDFASGGYEASGFPAAGAALRYSHRMPLKPGIERQIRQQIQSLFTP